MKLNSIVAITFAAGLIAIAGCASSRPAPAKSEPARTKMAWPTHTSSNTETWSHLAYPTGDSRTSALGIQKGMPREVRLNQPFDYTLVATNLTDEELTDIVVTDSPGTGLKVTGSEPKSAAGDRLVWKLGTLGSHESKTIRVNATAAQVGSVGSCTSATYASELCAMTDVVAPALAITKTGPESVLKCEEIEYKVVVTNSGTGTVMGVEVNDTLPTGLRSADGKTSIVVPIGDLKAGQSKNATIKAKAEQAGSFENTATAKSAGGLTATSTKVTTRVFEPVLKIEKKCSPKQFVGRAFDYEITVTNTGNGEARDTVIEDVIPSGCKFANATAGGTITRGTVTWNLGTLAPGAAKTVGLILEPAAAGKYENKATARAYCAASVSSVCTTEVTGIPAILLEVLDVEDPAEVGKTTTYIITVTNQGSAPGTNIRLACSMEENQEYVSSSGDSKGSGAGRSASFEPVRSLAAGQKATFRVVVRNVKVGDVRFKTSMTSDQLTRPVEETEATNVYQ